MAKKIDQRTLTGRLGANVIERVVTEMGFLWHPTGIEAGIDGFVEFRDPTSGVVLNLTLAVQSKASAATQPNRDGQYTFICDQADLTYWLSGNLPIILVFTVTATAESFWVSIKDYFNSPTTRQSGKITFDSTKDKFDRECARALMALARPKDSGIYFKPPPAHEQLFSNLLPVSFPKSIYHAMTSFRSSMQLLKSFETAGIKQIPDFVLTSGGLLAFHDLREEPWSRVCEQGTAEKFDTADWSHSTDKARRSVFVNLLERCLFELTLRRGLVYQQEFEYYYFPKSSGNAPVTYRFRGPSRNTEHTVVEYKIQNNTKFNYYKHAAFYSRFLMFGEEYFLEVTPTWYYSWNGTACYKYYEELLKGIKRLERNPAVMSKVLLWTDLLKSATGLFAEDDYKFLKVSDSLVFELNTGIDEKSWLSNADADEVEDLTKAVDEASLLP